MVNYYDIHVTVKSGDSFNRRYYTHEISFLNLQNEISAARQLTEVTSIEVYATQSDHDFPHDDDYRVLITEWWLEKPENVQAPQRTTIIQAIQEAQHNSEEGLQRGKSGS